MPRDGMACVAPHMAMYGARNEAMAFTNCPKVSELANRSPLTMLESNGLSDVCISALPMPSNENESSIST